MNNLLRQIKKLCDTTIITIRRFEVAKKYDADNNDTNDEKPQIFSEQEDVDQTNDDDDVGEVDEEHHLLSEQEDVNQTKDLASWLGPVLVTFSLALVMIKFIIVIIVMIVIIIIVIIIIITCSMRLVIMTMTWTLCSQTILQKEGLVLANGPWNIQELSFHLNPNKHY